MNLKSYIKGIIVRLFLASRYESDSPRSSPLLESFAAEMFPEKGP